MVFCLLLTFYTVYQIALVISDYATYPKKITRDQAEDRRWVTFPGVTICTLSPLPRTNALKEHPLWGTFIEVENFNSTKCTANDMKKDISKHQTKMVKSKASPKTLRQKRSEDQIKEEEDYYYSPFRDSLDDNSQPFAMSATFDDHFQEKLRRLKRDLMLGMDTTDTPGAYEDTTGAYEDTTGAYEGTTANCPSTYECPDGSCIPFEFICDQIPDCASGVDEENCKNCTQYQFTCFDGKCIPLSWKCDDMADCSQAEDEFVCNSGNETMKCSTGNRTCADGSCLREIYVCDGVQDCNDGDDEVNCDSCSGRSFRCNDGQCIPSYHVCDGIPQCIGLEDEGNCSANTTSCPEDHYVCELDQKCLNPRFLCNKISDCVLGDDENGTMCNSTVEASPAHQVRLKCSRIYNDTMYVNLAIYGDEEDLGTMSCDMGDGEFTEVSSFSPMCVEGYTCDYYGCYSIKARFYSEYSQTKGVTCAFCAGTEICWAQNWINQLEQGQLSSESLKLMLTKEKSDFNDLTELFIPTEEEKENYSISASEFIYSCKFGGTYCDYRNFQKWISDDYGTCYSFNSPLDGDNREPYQISNVGPMYGLDVTLNVRTGMAVLSKELGVRVSIHRPGVLPVPLEEGFNVGPGTSSVRLSRTSKILLGNPHGNCSSEYSRGAPFKEYSRPICKALCVEDRIRRLCKCIKGKSPVYANMSTNSEKHCDSLSMEDEICLQRVKTEFSYGEIDCKCFQPCREMTYDPKVTTSKVNDYYFDLLHHYRRKVSSLCSGDTHLLTLNIYLDSPYYEVIEEAPAYTFDTLVSNIGGSLGLFIGVSIISIMEVIEFVIDIVLVSMRIRKGRIQGGDADEGQGKVMYPAESCGSYVSVDALQHLRQQMTHERDQDIEALRKEMAKEKEVEREQIQREMTLQEQRLSKEVETVKQKYQDDLETYLDASVDRIIGGW